MTCILSNLLIRQEVKVNKYISQLDELFKPLPEPAASTKDPMPPTFLLNPMKLKIKKYIPTNKKKLSILKIQATKRHTSCQKLRNPHQKETTNT